MPTIVPSLLVESETAFLERINNRLMHLLAPVWHFDILDGTMFHATAWADLDVISNAEILPVLELHLMIEHPIETLRTWKRRVTHVRRAIIHAEIQDPLPETLLEIKNLGLEVGLALNPDTDLASVASVMDDVDMLLIMGVHPGKSGQSFLEDQILPKIEEARLRYPHVRIAVDGGVNTKNAQAIVKAGADQLVTATTLWGSKDLRETFVALKNA